MSVFGWTYVDGNGEEVGRSHRFEECDAAEDWMGESWRDLLENGVAEVVLVDHSRDRTLYRMDLAAE
jgi:hypothetical protein